MKSYRLILILVILTALVFCKENQSKYDDNYAKALIVQLAISQPSATTSCANAIQKQEECFAIQALNQGITLPISSQTTRETQCSNIRQNSSYNKMSERAQACVFDCQTTDWTTKISTNECKTSTGQNLVISGMSNAKVTACIRSCFQATNNQVSDAEILNLLLFNLIQNGE